MLTARVLAAMWLLLIGVIWLIVAYVVDAIMSGIATSVYPMWLNLIVYYGPPTVLIVGAVLVLTRGYTRSGVVLASFACTFVTRTTVWDSWPWKSENNAVQYDWFFLRSFSLCCRLT